jgi:hypothetical protein
MAGWFSEYGFSMEEKRLGTADKIDGATDYIGLPDEDWLDTVIALPPDRAVAIEAVDVNLLVAAYQDGKIEANEFYDLLPGALSARAVRRRLRQAGIDGIVCYSAKFEEPWMIGYCGRKQGDSHP